MASLLLNTGTIIMCPHGGMVTHAPLTVTSYRVDGRLPMLQSDNYIIVGCSNNYGRPSPCFRVTWASASNLLVIRGERALTLDSVGICQSASGIAQGPAIITYTQTGQREPSLFTTVNN